MNVFTEAGTKETKRTSAMVSIRPAHGLCPASYKQQGNLQIDWTVPGF